MKITKYINAKYIANIFSSSQNKTTPADADIFPSLDSDSSFSLVYVSWTNIKAALSYIFILAAGKAGGQTVYGGGATGEDLTLHSNIENDGFIKFGTNSVYDETYDRFGINQIAPSAKGHLKGSTSDSSAYSLKIDNSSDVSLLSVRNDGLVDFGNGFTNQNIFKEDDYLMPTNPFGGKTVNYNQFHNALFLADRRWTVVANYHLKSDDSLIGAVDPILISNFFDGNYESYLEIPLGQYVLVQIDFGGIWTSYGYGYVYTSHYHTGFAESEELQVYCNYDPHTIGWKYEIMTDYVNNGINSLIRRARNSWHLISLMNIKIVSPDSGITAKPTQLDWVLERPVPGKEMPFVTKFTDETLYNDLDFKDESGNVVTHLSNNSNSYFLNNLGIGQSSPASRTHLKGSTSDSSAYSLKIDNSSDVSLLSVRNDGLINVSGDLVFTGSDSGLPYGSIYSYNNTTNTTINFAGKTQISIFDTNGVNNSMTPDYTNNHVAITTAGVYQLSLHSSVSNQAGLVHKISVSIWKNNGATEFSNTSIHRTLEYGTDTVSIGITAHIYLAVDDTIEVWANTDSSVDSDVLFEDINMNLTMIGG